MHLKGRHLEEHHSAGFDREHGNWNARPFFDAEWSGTVDLRDQALSTAERWVFV